MAMTEVPAIYQKVQAVAEERAAEVIAEAVQSARSPSAEAAAK
jgi:hypothetical protein